MAKSRTLTLATLETNRACVDSRKVFAERFSLSVEITVELAVTQALEWDWMWAADHLLNHPINFYDQTRPAVDLYRNTMDPVWKNLRAVEVQADEAYTAEYRKWRDSGIDDETAYDRGMEVYRSIFNPQQSAVREQDKHAREALSIERARVWATLYIKEGSENG